LLKDIYFFQLVQWRIQAKKRQNPNRSYEYPNEAGKIRKSAVEPRLFALVGFGYLQVVNAFGMILPSTVNVHQHMPLLEKCLTNVPLPFVDHARTYSNIPMVLGYIYYCMKERLLLVVDKNDLMNTTGYLFEHPRTEWCDFELRLRFNSRCDQLRLLKDKIDRMEKPFSKGDGFTLLEIICLFLYQNSRVFDGRMVEYDLGFTRKKKITTRENVRLDDSVVTAIDKGLVKQEVDFGKILTSIIGKQAASKGKPKSDDYGPLDLSPSLPNKLPRVIKQFAKAYSDDKYTNQSGCGSIVLKAYGVKCIEMAIRCFLHSKIAQLSVENFQKAATYKLPEYPENELAKAQWHPENLCGEDALSRDGNLFGGRKLLMELVKKINSGIDDNLKGNLKEASDNEGIVYIEELISKIVPEEPSDDEEYRKIPEIDAWIEMVKKKEAIVKTTGSNKQEKKRKASTSEQSKPPAKKQKKNINDSESEEEEFE
jgi:hypothetical protein